MIRVQSLTKKYANRTVLKGLNFSIPAGEIVGFLGPNGAGKTTTLKIIAGLMEPSSGEVFIDGKSLSQNLNSTKIKIGYLPEVAPLYDDMTVNEYLSFVADIKLVPHQEKQKYILKTLEEVHLQQIQNQRIYQLSKGYRQRVGLAQALVSQPQVLILDEPTSGFDPQQISEFKTLLKSLAGKCTVFLSSHHLADIESLCNEVVVINKGEIVAQGSQQQIQKKLQQNPRIHLQLDQSANDTALQNLRNLSGVKTVEVLPSQKDYIITVQQDIGDLLLRWALDSQLKILKLETQSASLEDLFLNLTKESEGAFR